MKCQLTLTKRSPVGAAFLVCFGLVMGHVNTSWAQPASFAFTPTNQSGTFYGQATVDGVPANENDWIAAFDAAGNCAGAAQVVMNEGLAYINLPIYGDDATTEGVDEGMGAGEFFTLHLWRSTYGGVLNYPAMDALVIFEGWVNTNGAPMPGFDDPTTVYNFEEPATAPSISGPSSTCLDASTFALETSPAGGVVNGPGVVDGIFNPAVAGLGTHTLDYIVDGVIVSWTIEVLASYDATILTEGPFCADDAAVELEAVNEGGTWTGEGVFDGAFEPAFVSPGTVNITYTLGQPDDACFATSQQAITVYPTPTAPEVVLTTALDGTPQLEVSPQVGVTFTWFTESMELLAEGSVLTGYDGQPFVVVATNTFGCDASTEGEFSIASVSEGQAERLVWLDARTLKLTSGVEKVTMWDAGGRLLWSQPCEGAQQWTLPLPPGCGWRLVAVHLASGEVLRTSVVR
ncbi:hypothetical protein N9V29_02485 [Flavobacteriales bacterium]|nr:hypothetical protein [Flavobacteriales bacterium]